jgi:hypothetical protein
MRPITAKCPKFRVFSQFLVNTRHISDALHILILLIL